jgi:CheY-like chemotaxis protein
VAVIYAHVSEPPPRLSGVCPDLPEGLDAVIGKALEKTPERRFRTGAELLAAARAVIDAAGPLADTVTPRPVPAFGDAFDVPTSVGLERPAPAATAPPAAPERVAAARRPRVLLAGLDPTSTAAARVVLAASAELTEATPGDELVGAVREERPDLVILRWEALDRPAAELVGALRTDAVTRDAKLLLLVDHRHSASREVAAAGADERLATPFSALQLQVKLRKLLGAEAMAG